MLPRNAKAANGLLTVAGIIPVARKPMRPLTIPIVCHSPNCRNTPTVTRPLAERGYYVFPVYLTDLVLKDFGLAEAGHIHLLATQRLHELFGADAALYITIKDWSSKYILLASTVAVEMDYELRDTRTGMVLWQANEKVVQSSGGAGGGLIGMAIAAAVNAMATDYQPLARQANKQVFLPPKGLPAGPYHLEYGRDQEKF
ncbi:GNA1162 family protein [Nitrosovibrio sp. Nv4]|uniref:GNA1162 family protein n=1 Tax=Nitrosovibrio sp. Nv4 TaxID=1945880 RepID=UPI000BD95B5D|nr:GNA1162 family protein [Nitrosovibrio sp. Nv4]SOD42711.1 hypothetical protein SAMN06298226_3071 [Nitrosovibrio sp. Nv4]